MATVSSNQAKEQSSFLTKKLLPWTLYALILVTLLHFYLNTLSFPPSPQPQLLHSLNSHSSPHSPPPSGTHTCQQISCTRLWSLLSFFDLLHLLSFADDEKGEDTSCDYFNGKWVRDKRGPLYNGTTCGTIKENQNCITHGRPDMGYLYWRWKPNECHLPRFDPLAFLNLVRNKHLAFVGDSMARNQLESLLCMLTTASSSTLLYNNDSNKFRRWHFASHNVSVSLYWSPFLVKGVEKSNGGPDHNELYLDHVDERWGADIGEMSLIVLSIGHWFLHPAVYYEGGLVLGCHYCPGLNHTEIGFYDVLRKALRSTLNGIVDRRGGKGGSDGVGVIVTTFSPAHFEGEWDKAGACPKTRPYGKEEKKVEGMDAEMREIEMKEVEAAKVKAKGIGGFRLEALDVTKLALLRPDGHPGPYMYPFPFSNGAQERVQNDCVHWCLPGPIDTWNEIFLQILKKWEEQHKTEE